MVQFRSIKVKGIFTTMAKSGKSARFVISDKEAIDVLWNDALKKMPTWKQNHSEDEREFAIGKQGMFEVYDDDEECPPNFDNTKPKEEAWEPTEDDDTSPF